jgi:FkbM family methyltransferase
LDYEAGPWSELYSEVPRRFPTRPLSRLATNSYLGTIYVPLILAKRVEVIAVVDDQSTGETIHGIVRWSSAEFRSRAGQLGHVRAIDLSFSPLGNAVFDRLLRESNVERVDLVQLLADLDLPAVYQTPSTMRDITISRQSEWRALRDSFEDEWSRLTLDAVLLLRLTYDRRHLRAAIASPEEEYFSVYQFNSTFALRNDEIFCDAGAYIGTTVRKVIAATGCNFRLLHAFEPDKTNFTALQALDSLKLPNLALHNAAVGDFTGTVSFCETGTMGSHVDETSGNGATRITRLDDAIDDATFIKMDLEGFEKRALAGARGLIDACRPRLAITTYHYADDLLDICSTIRSMVPDYVLRLRHHSNYFYDTIVYAAPRGAH